MGSSISPSIDMQLLSQTSVQRTIHLITGHMSGIVVPVEALATRRRGQQGPTSFEPARFRFREVEVVASNGLEAVVRGLREGIESVCTARWAGDAGWRRGGADSAAWRGRMEGIHHGAENT